MTDETNHNVFDPNTFNYDEYVAYQEAERERQAKRVHQVFAIIISIVFAGVQLLTLYLVAVETLPLWQAVIVLLALNAAIYLELNRAFINKT